MIGYKLFRKRSDGSYGPLFINRKQKLYPQEEYTYESHPTKGFAVRPGWHICGKPVAPHLKKSSDRVWCKVVFDPMAEVKRPESQGGVWYLGKSMRIIGEIYDGSN
jgi:hypothetical protein